MVLAKPPALLFYRALQAAKNSVILEPKSLNTPLNLSTSQKEFQWWLDWNM